MQGFDTFQTFLDVNRDIDAAIAVKLDIKLDDDEESVLKVGLCFVCLCVTPVSCLCHACPVGDDRPHEISMGRQPAAQTT